MQKDTGYTRARMAIGIIVMARPFDGAVIGSAVLLGMFASSASVLPLHTYVLGFLMGFVLLAAMDTFNDYRDRDIDSISKPWRPIPRGFPPELALLTAIIETVAGFILARLLGTLIIVTIIVAVGIAIAYSMWLKPYFLAKNIVVAAGLSLAVVAGVLVTVSPITGNILFLLVLVFAVAFCFEIHKDLGDVAGDSTHGVKTIPAVLGERKTVMIIMIGYTVSWVLAAVFILVNDFSEFYLVVLVITAVSGLYTLYLLNTDAMKYLERTRRIVTAAIGLLLLAMINLFT